MVDKQQAIIWTNDGLAPTGARSSADTVLTMK